MQAGGDSLPRGTPHPQPFQIGKPSMKWKLLLVIPACLLVYLLYTPAKSNKMDKPILNSPEVTESSSKSDENDRADLRQRLTPEQYHVTQEKGTEHPFTGKYWNHDEKGMYHCVVCGAELFTSDSKFDSGCGWPSFYESSKTNVSTNVDTTHGMVRDEITCSKCGAHLGHVFPDGPKPTGLRYCVNSASIDFEAKDKE
jgi:peptide-methionine (R)-S-oxide reductase